MGIEVHRNGQMYPYTVLDGPYRLVVHIDRRCRGLDREERLAVVLYVQFPVVPVVEGDDVVVRTARVVHLHPCRPRHVVHQKIGRIVILHCQVVTLAEVDSLACAHAVHQRRKFGIGTEYLRRPGLQHADHRFGPGRSDGVVIDGLEIEESDDARIGNAFILAAHKSLLGERQVIGHQVHLRLRGVLIVADGLGVVHRIGEGFDIGLRIVVGRRSVEQCFALDYQRFELGFIHVSVAARITALLVAGGEQHDSRTQHEHESRCTFQKIFHNCLF